MVEVKPMFFEKVRKKDEPGSSLSSPKEEKAADSDSSGIKNVKITNTDSSTEEPSQYFNDSQYPGDLDEVIVPVKETGFEKLDIPDPGMFVNIYNEQINRGDVTLHKWQDETLVEIGTVKPTAQHPYKLCLITCNGSGKDAFIIASTVCWFAACKIRARVIVTSSSGVQLTSQTEGYIRALCHRVNEFHGCEIFRIRQRYITCRLSGSEIRLFATDEEGKAEGYHPLEPNAEMLIVVNEGKSVTEEIHKALRRCSGYNYWLEVSTPGEPFGAFYKAATTWSNVRRVDYTMCPHLSADEIEADRLEYGEDSELFRSKNLALFTTVSGSTVIPQTLVTKILERCKRGDIPIINLPHLRIGLDLAAGGDECSVTGTKGNQVVKEVCFREKDTEVSADRIDYILKNDFGLDKTCEHIYADDGGVGRSIIDKLIHKGWKINRVLNQSPPISGSILYGNRGAENWYRIKRILEEYLFDISKLSQKTLEQLYTRHYRDRATTAKLFLESKQEARNNGRPSPDRADSLILSLTGLTVEDFRKGEIVAKPKDNRPRDEFHSQDAILEHYENTVTFENFNKRDKVSSAGRIYNSLRRAMMR